MEFRIGIILGDVLTESDNLYGDGVNVSALSRGTMLNQEEYACQG